MTDQELWRAYQAGISAHPTGRRDCPDPETITALLEREGKEADRLALLDHLMACPACRRDFELLRAVHVAAPARTRRLLQPLALAASVALTAGLTWGLWSMLQTDQVDTLRGGDARIEPVAPASDAVVSLPVQLAWRPVSDASLYAAELLTHDGLVMQSWVTADTSVTVPVSGGATVQAGAYAWWVRTRLRDGTERRSPVVRFEVR